MSISRINPLKFGGGLKFELDPREISYAFHGAGAGIGQKGVFFKGLWTLSERRKRARNGIKQRCYWN